MTPDHYATLGLKPTCEEAVIHGVYRALMRQYDPDKNPSPAAAERAKAITAAYAVLGDPDKRLSYDETQGYILRIEVPANEESHQRHLVPNGLSIAAATLWRRAVTAADVRAKELWGRAQSQSNLAPALRRSAQVVAGHQKQRFKLARVRLHTSTATFYDTLVCAAGSLLANWRKLTRRDIADTKVAPTPDLRTSKSNDASRLQSVGALEAMRKLERSYEHAQDRRRAYKALELPSPPRLNRVHYGLIAASVLALAVVPLAFRQAPQRTADPIVRSAIETPARTPPRSLPPSSNELRVASVPAVAMPILLPTPDPTAKPAAIADRVPTQEPKLEKAPRVTALPPSAPLTPRERPVAATTTKVTKPVTPASTKCASARPGADTAVCNNDNLAALDQLAATYHEQSLKAGNVAKRSALVDARNDFLSRREACRSETCLRSAYVRHMREISGIIESK